ncbi:MAG: metal-sensitive transcriptional regulator [Bifidobacterium tibiigranuli]|jgi:DNA-binding FrmR family transcriptional regulator|uniref:metal-sensitive transcriptional regulator n=1 Tax=Bifidobacterium tibiigranuli TaxID=2172043 RepID=UPI0023539A6F|nr:metal-sensitive transcriptional regulator [Bifidobacterium tibiigranuli]MCH3973835.1 metal-sensitive transcriptional regulator [Bifidobacterium tibiigranuli]MCH4189385.1 metal-sensitive transcriptional regulator [Bifidobacterium tibiigranuli]MCH4203830.1 metal-sensitive transcriptional regulator [Bifidobacterium tibiigranuli]MCH4274328.1 metal-sensitive transcriptional regulator [Bifidobacterium tibiigranuli]MCI1791449.1 metal-sensitive transcriptional regulator [Bifidobacterium tibiigranul
MSSTTTKKPENPQRAVLNRLKRARGQLDAVINQVESGGSCQDVVIQLSAVSRALDRAGFLVIASAMRECLAPSEEENGEQLEAAEGGESVHDDSATMSGGDSAHNSDATQIANHEEQGPKNTRLTADEIEKLFLMLA